MIICRTSFKASLDKFVTTTRGTLDFFYNDTGTGGRFFDIDFDDVTRFVNINFVAVLIGIHLVYPMLKAAENQFIILLLNKHYRQQKACQVKKVD